MKTLTEIKATLQAQKLYLSEKYGGTEIGVFGSYVRGEQRPDSDLDILIELTDPPRISLMGLVNLENYLGDLLGVKVETAMRQHYQPGVSRVVWTQPRSGQAPSAVAGAAGGCCTTRAR